jgi:hypothetical protein
MQGQYIVGVKIKIIRPEKRMHRVELFKLQSLQIRAIRTLYKGNMTIRDSLNMFTLLVTRLNLGLASSKKLYYPK